MEAYNSLFVIPKQEESGKFYCINEIRKTVTKNGVNHKKMHLNFNDLATLDNYSKILNHKAFIHYYTDLKYSFCATEIIGK